jgi:hypothetical protein
MNNEFLIIDNLPSLNYKMNRLLFISLYRKNCHDLHLDYGNYVSYTMAQECQLIVEKQVYLAFIMFYLNNVKFKDNYDDFFKHSK